MSTKHVLFEQIDSLKQELDSMRPLDSEQENRVMQKFRLWWTYHSNAIEGNALTQGETEAFLMEGLTAKGKPLKDHLDLRGHSNAINYLLGFIRNKEVLTEAAIRALHEILLVEPYRIEAITPDGQPTTKIVGLGQYKTQPNHVRTQTGEIHFYASPEETPAKMGDLLSWYRKKTDSKAMHNVEIAARFHHRFTAIHPFDDGNGRMSRLLMNLMLMQSGYPPVVIRLSERDAYLAALRKADRNEYDDFVELINEHVINSLQLYLRAAKGEEIEEPTDLEKEIALFKMELRHIEEPEPLTQELQKVFFERSLDPLFADLVRLMRPLCELFAESILHIEGTYGELGRGGRMFNFEKLFLVEKEFPRPEGCWAGKNLVQEMKLSITLNGFKKARFDTFNVVAIVRLRFEKLKYIVVLNQRNAGGGEVEMGNWTHFFQETMSKNEIRRIAGSVARFVLEETKKRSKNKS